jgi:hypothetical protein
MTVAQYNFPSQYYPTSPHPRVWLTQERIATLQQARQSNTVEWQTFANRVAYVMNPANESAINQPWFQYAGAIPYTALMYRLTGDTTYAAKTLYFAMKADTNQAPGHAIAKDDDWIGGNTAFLALGFDWIYDYMTPTQRQGYLVMIKAFCENLWKIALHSGTGLTYNCMDTDRLLSCGGQEMMFGSAIFGDDTAGVTYLNRGWFVWTRGISQNLNEPDPTLRPHPARDFVKHAVGGVYYTGLEYTTGTDLRGIGWYFTTLRTACNYDISIVDPQLAPFWKNFLRSVIDQTDPPMHRWLNIGDFQDDPIVGSPSSPQPWTKRALNIAEFEAAQNGGADWAAYGKAYEKKIQPFAGNDAFTEFFFITPSITPVDPYSSNLPLVRTSEGTESYLFFRDNWTTTARYGAFSGNGMEPADHQNEDVGGFTLFRNDDYLTRSATGYYDFEDAGLANNSLSIPNGSVYGSPLLRTRSGVPSSMVRHRENNAAPIFAYAMIQGDGQWNHAGYMTNPAVQAPVKSYRRHFFWAGDYVVVFDRLRTVAPLAATYKLRALTQPVVNGTVVAQMSENGNQKLLHKTLQPAGLVVHLLDENTLLASFASYQIQPTERRWQTRVVTPPGDSVNILSVMQMGPSTMADFDTLGQISDAGNAGVRIGDWVVDYASAEQMRSSVDYTVSNSVPGMHHLVADLAVGSYDVFVNSVKSASAVVGANDNTGYFVTPNAGSLAVSIRPTGLGVGDAVATTPVVFELEQNYPNPANPTTRIAYVIPSGAGSENTAGSGLQVAGSGKTAGSEKTAGSREQVPGSGVRLAVYDVLGREVAVLVDGVQSPGRHEVVFDGGNVSSGVYFYRLQAGDVVQTKRMVIVR